MSVFLNWEDSDGKTLRWPNPSDPFDAIWTARFTPSNLTKDQSIWLTAAAHAYGALVYLPTNASHRKIIQIRKALKEGNMTARHSGIDGTGNL